MLCSCPETMGDNVPLSRPLAEPSSTEKRILVFAVCLAELARRFPVLRFLGRWRGT